MSSYSSDNPNEFPIEDDERLRQFTELGKQFCNECCNAAHHGEKEGFGSAECPGCGKTVSIDDPELVIYWELNRLYGKSRNR